MRRVKLPKIGAPIHVYMGVTRFGACCTVASVDDVARRCTVVGYSVCVGRDAKVSILTHPTNVDVTLHVRVHHPVHRLKRFECVHPSCIMGFGGFVNADSELAIAFVRTVLGPIV